MIIIPDGASLIQAKELLMKGLGENESKYLTAVGENFPNISKYFIQDGSFTANGISVWPSSSIPAHTGIMTGSYPRLTGVMGQRQFNPKTRKHTSYIGLGILSHRQELAKKVKTLFEYFPSTRSVAFLQIANRGASLYVPSTPHDKLVLKNLSETINASDLLSKYTGKKEIPRIVVATLPDIDHQTHNTLMGDKKVTDLYLSTDEYVGQIFELYKSKGILDKTLFVLASDHGMGTVSNHVTLDNLMHDLRFDTFQSLKWSVVPAWGSFEANFYVGSRYKLDNKNNSLALWGGNSDGLIYIKGQKKDASGKVFNESWDIHPTDEDLANYQVGGTKVDIIKKLINGSPGIGLILTNPTKDTFNIYSSKGQSQIKEKQINGQILFQYQLKKGEDPLGYINNPSIAPYIKNASWLSDQQWLYLSYLESYPDAIRRVSYSFGNVKSATLHVVAANGWDFTPYYVAKDVLVGSHGSLNSDHSYVPIMFHGPGVKQSEMPYARTVDILPTVLSYFGLSTNGVNGRPLPIFEDEKKNNNISKKNTYFVTEDDFSDQKYFYSLEDIYSSYDKQLVKTNKLTKEREILIPSIKKALPQLNTKVNLTLNLISYDKTDNQLIFEEYYLAENKKGNRISYNLITKELIPSN